MLGSHFSPTLDISLPKFLVRMRIPRLKLLVYDILKQYSVLKTARFNGSDRGMRRNFLASTTLLGMNAGMAHYLPKMLKPTYE